MPEKCGTCGGIGGKHHIVCSEFKRQLETIVCKNENCQRGFNKKRRSCPHCGEVKK